MKVKTVFLSVITALVFILGVECFAQTQSFKVPNGKPILLDGKCETGEWNEAGAIAVGKDFKLSFKKTGDFTFFCLQPPKEQVFSVDFYLSPENRRLYTLHVSAKLGERALDGEKWKEWTTDWDWWQTNGWTANALRPNNFEKRTFFPSRAIEFQISRVTFAGKKSRVMLDVSGGSLLFPASADNLKRETWAEFVL